LIRALGLALILLALAACGRDPGLSGLAPGEEGRVADVRSGDTFTLDSGLEVRLAGVEAPKGDQPYAYEARAALLALADGRSVRLLYGGARRNRYDRALAQVTRKSGGLWVQKTLLRAGAVRMRTWADNRAMAGPMLEAEAYARNRKLGLWALPEYRVLIPPEAADAYGFQIVEGRVRRVGPDRLEFDAGFEAEIADQALDDFKTAAKAPDQLRGRLVRVRGPIRGGVLKLDHPEQVELLKERD
jgi:endonuclease YncB( thermonuclease family)